jgi:excisionase family DNA binding protein
VSENDYKITITPAWLNYKQAEAYSNLSRTTLWQLISARKIKAARIGRAVRIERDSLQAFMEQSTEDSGGRPDGYDGTRVKGDSANAILPN